MVSAKNLELILFSNFTAKTSEINNPIKFKVIKMLSFYFGINLITAKLTYIAVFLPICGGINLLPILIFCIVPYKLQFCLNPIEEDLSCPIVIEHHWIYDRNTFAIDHDSKPIPFYTVQWGDVCVLEKPVYENLTVTHEASLSNNLLLFVDCHCLKAEIRFVLFGGRMYT